MKIEILYHPGDANYTWKLYGRDQMELTSTMGWQFRWVKHLKKLSNTKSGMVWIIVVKNYEYKNQSRNDCG
jgi:hypothetical protein